MGTMMACAPQSSARLIIHGSEPAILTMGDTPDDDMAPTCRYMSRSSMLPCSVSTRTHYDFNFRQKCSRPQYASRVEGVFSHTSAPNGATVRARVYPGNSSHCPTQGGPSPLLAFSRTARRRVLPVGSTTGNAIWFDIIASADSCD
jgi:hypothetical protein